jgi:hypothetical protein
VGIPVQGCTDVSGAQSLAATNVARLSCDRLPAFHGTKPGRAGITGADTTMSDVTIKQLAGVLGMGVDKLLVQLAEAGMKFSNPDQVVSSTEKVKLLGFLRRTHGKIEKQVEDSSPTQITLKRKTVS